MLKDKNILLGITGGIAAYKMAELSSLCTKQGAKVKAIMTENAIKFISPLTIQSITHQSVSVKNVSAENIEHIDLADWADIFVIAPATANIIGKIAAGIADDLLSTTILASQAPKLIVPAMNVHMYENPIVQHNLDILRKYGFYIMPPDEGKLACGYSGKGRLPDPIEIISFIDTYLSHKRDFEGKNILITAGATKEAIDSMRFITNHSTGKTGIAIAKAAYIRGANVKLIAASVAEQIPQYLNVIKVTSAADMYNAVMNNLKNIDIIIKTAAVSDYTPKYPKNKKIKKSEDINLELVRTKDILNELGRIKKDFILVGFAAESENLMEYAKIKLEKKNLDFIVANNLAVAGKNETEVMVMDKSGNSTKLSGLKLDVANKILSIIKNG